MQKLCLELGAGKALVICNGPRPAASCAPGIQRWDIRLASRISLIGRSGVACLRCPYAVCMINYMLEEPFLHPRLLCFPGLRDCGGVLHGVRG